MILETPPKGILSDEDAVWMESNLETAPPEKKAFVSAKLNEYKAFRAQHPKPFTPEEAKQYQDNETAVLGLYEAPDKADFGPGMAMLPSGEQSAQKARVMNEYFLGHVTRKGRESYMDSMTYAMERGRIAGELFGGRGADSDTGFAKEAAGYLAQRKEVRTLAETYSKLGTASALKLNPTDGFSDLSQVQSDAFSDGAEYGGDVGKQLVDNYRTARAGIEAKAGPLRPVAREVFAMLSKGKQERFGEEAQAGIEGAIDKLAELPEDQRGLVVAMLQTEGGTDTSGNTAEKTGSAAIRGVTGQLRKLASNTQRTSILSIQKQIQDGRISVPDGTPMADVFRQKVGMAAPDVLSTMAGSTRPATDAEKKELAALADKALTRSEVAQQAVDILEGNLDPISTSGIGQRVAVNVGSSLGAMAPAFIPYAGLVIQQGAFADSEYQRQRQMGTDPQTANTIAQVTGTVQAGLDRAQALAAISLPKMSVGRLATSGVAGNAAARATIGIAGVQAAEYAIESAQNAVPILTTSLAGSMGWTVPQQAQFKAELERWKVWDPEMFMTLLPLSLVGGGFQGVNNAAVAKQYMADVDGLQAVGIAPVDARRIAELPEEKRVPAFQEAYASRDPSTPEAAAAQQAVADRTAASIQQGQEEVSAMTDAGLSITRTAEGYAVTDTEAGTALQLPTAEEAMSTARSVMTERGMVREESFLDALDTFTGIMQPGRTIEISERSAAASDLLKDLVLAESEGKTATVQAIWERADQFRASVGEEALQRDMNNPDSRNALQGLNVLGSSVQEAQENASNLISKVLREGGTLDLVEEQAENDLRAAVSASRVSMDTMRGMLERIEASTGDKYLFGNTDTAVYEGWSALTRLYATATRNGNRITKAARTETVAELRAERRRVREAEGQGVAPAAFAKLREYYDQLRAMLGKAARLMKSAKDGKLDELESMIRESVGLKEQDAHEAGVVKQMEEFVKTDVQNDKPTFAITTADRLERLSKEVGKMAKSPEVRVKMFDNAVERLTSMRRSVAFNDKVFVGTNENMERRNMLRMMQALDAILTPFPPEVRSKVGGFIKLASLRTNRQMESYIKNRIERLGEVTEEYLRKEYVGEIEALIKKGSAKREAGNKPGGKLGGEGHALFDKVKAAAKMTEGETDTAIATLSDAIEDARVNDPDAVPELSEKLSAAVMFGALNSKERSARDLSTALKWLQENYDRERTKWRTAEEARLAEVALLAEGGINDLGGKVGPSDRLNSTSKLGEFRAGGTSFSGAVRAIFGKDSTLADRWTKAARQGIIQRSEEFRKMKEEWKALKDGLYGKGWKGDRKLHDELVERKEKTGVKITDKMVISRQTIPVSVAENILAGNAPDLAAKYSTTEQAEMRAALDANILEKRPKDAITLTRVSGSTAGNEITLSQGEAMHLSLMWRQPQGKRPMEANGYTDETMKEIEDFMSPNAKVVRDFIAKKYTDEWGSLNSVFAGMFGVNLPQIENYSPLTFWSQQRKELTNSDPMGGPVMPQGGMSTGMLKERMEQHGAEPRVVNAVDVFFDHMRKTAHFKAFAELAREMRGVMGKKEMRRALDTKHGEVGTQLIDKWMDAIEQGGLTQKPGWFEDTVAKMGGARAVAVLAWNFKSALTNSLNLLGAARAIPAPAYARGLAKLFSGRLNWWAGKGSTFQSSAIIQRRIDAGISPEMQAAMTRMNAMTPGRLKAFAEAGMNLHAYADAFFTSGSLAIAHDYHLRQFLADGIPAAEAERLAMEATEQTVAEYTQPTEFIDRSTMEMERNALSRAVFAFMSDPRQKMAKMMEAGAEKDYKRLAKLIAIDHVVSGAIMAFIAAAWRDLNDDDDGDVILDPLHWKVSDFLAAMAMGPWGAFPIFGPAMQGAVSSIQGTPTNDNSLLGSIGSISGSIWRRAESAAKGDEPVEDLVALQKQFFITVSTALGDPRVGVASRAGSMAFDLVDNFFETQDESDIHELKMRRLKDKEKNPEKEKTDEQKATAAKEKKSRQARELEKLRREQGA